MQQIKSKISCYLTKFFIYFTISMEFPDQKDMCTRAYFFLRCVTIWNLVYGM